MAEMTTFCFRIGLMNNIIEDKETIKASHPLLLFHRVNAFDGETVGHSACCLIVEPTFSSVSGSLLNSEEQQQQGRIHGHQLRTGGQGQ